MLGLESLGSSGKCTLEGVKHPQMIDISPSLCISVWSLGEGAPEESEKRDDAQRSTLFVEKPQSGTVSVGKCLEQNQKPLPETEAGLGMVCADPVALRFCPQLQVMPLVSAGCELHSEGKRTVWKELFNSRQAQNLIIY